MQLKSQLKTFTSLMDLLVHQTTNNFKAAAEYISGTFFWTLKVMHWLHTKSNGCSKPHILQECIVKMERNFGWDGDRINHCWVGIKNEIKEYQYTNVLDAENKSFVCGKLCLMINITNCLHGKTWEKSETNYNLPIYWHLVVDGQEKKIRRASGLYTQFPDFGMRKYL